MKTSDRIFFCSSDEAHNSNLLQAGSLMQRQDLLELALIWKGTDGKYRSDHFTLQSNLSGEAQIFSTSLLSFCSLVSLWYSHFDHVQLTGKI
jgi:hypothetical protein